jgi:hypothetical protein
MFLKVALRVEGFAQSSPLKHDACQRIPKHQLDQLAGRQDERSSNDLPSEYLMRSTIELRRL